MHYLQTKICEKLSHYPVETTQVSWSLDSHQWQKKKNTERLKSNKTSPNSLCVSRLFFGHLTQLPARTLELFTSSWVKQGYLSSGAGASMAEGFLKKNKCTLIFRDVFGQPGTPLYSYLDYLKTLILVGKHHNQQIIKGLLTYTWELLHRLLHSGDVMLTTIKKNAYYSLVAFTDSSFFFLKILPVTWLTAVFCSDNGSSLQGECTDSASSPFLLSRKLYRHYARICL